MLKLVRNIILGAILLAIALPWTGVIQDAFTGGRYRDYLEEHHQSVDLTVVGGDLQFDPDFYTNRLFIMGEIHGTQTSQLLDLRLMQHLNEQIGLRYIMAEMDPTQADRINAYLDTGNESLIRPVFRAWLAEAAQWGNQQHFEKLQQLYEYNASLPADRRFHYVGVDQIQRREIALDWFSTRLADISPTGAAAALLEALEREERQDDALPSLFDSALPQLAAEPDPVLAYMAQAIRADFDNPGRYERVLSNINTMVDVLAIGDDEPVYGFWGLFHSLGVTVNDGARPLVLRLRESDLPFAGAIANLTQSYANSSQNMPSHILPEPIRPDGPFFDALVSQDNPYLSYLDGIGDLKAVASDQNATIFRINAPGSPYENGGRLIEQSGLLTHVFRFEIDPFAGFATDYAILIRNSPAQTPYEDE
ncbi:hypothetical protein [Maricaulis parjimensis]|uniref:hypothetical protein n=1 Tax=Maricaulis parjimensis TaxID=144023 RepID=UPI0019393024|nr:hypothetical protein [Maricaulis parjimensis]